MSRSAMDQLRDANPLPTSLPAPPIDPILSRLDESRTVSLASLRGRPVVLNFWASWCATCKGEAPVLERDWMHHRSRGLVVLGVDYKDFAPDARRFVAAHGLTSIAPRSDGAAWKNSRTRNPNGPATRLPGSVCTALFRPYTASL